MSARAAALLVVVAGTAHAQPKLPSAAVVALTAPGPSAQRIESLRRALSTRYTLVEDAAIRGVLERFEAPDDLRAAVRARLEQARQRMQKLDVPAAQRLLAEAQRDALQLAPTPEGRGLVATVAARMAAAALVARELPAARRAAALALSAVPEFRLASAEAAPPLVALFDEVRQARDGSARVALHVALEPAQGQLVIAGETHAVEVAGVAVPARWPLVVWGVAEGHTPRALVVESPAAPVALHLSPIDAPRRLAPLVEALRQAGGDRHRELDALGGALGTDALVLVGSDERQAPVEIDLRHALVVAPLVAAPPVAAPGVATPATSGLVAKPPPKRPWYNKGWVWGVVVVGAVVVGGAIALGVVYGSPVGPAEVTCCR